MNIDNYLFKQAALKGEKTALKFRWLLIAVVFAFIIVTFLKGHLKEAYLAAIPAGIFLFYNIYLSYLIRAGKNFYFLRYFSVSVDIIALTIHIYINSAYFSPIAVSTTASIFIYPVLMFLSVLRYDKRLILYATLLTLIAFNLNYYIQFDEIDNELIKNVISSDPMGQFYKSGYILLLGIFFMQIPGLVYQFIDEQKETLEKKNESEFNLAIERKGKEILKNNIDKLNNLNTELKNKNRQIKEQNYKLNELVQTKDKLLSFISHDLKNSFSTMASIIETSIDNFENMQTEDISGAMHILFKHSKSNHELFDNILHWARSQSGKLPVYKEEFNLKSFYKNVFERFNEQFLQKNISFELVIDEKIIVYADKVMLKSILDNLIGNAIKFTPVNGNIKLEAYSPSINVFIHISDSGVGIPENMIDKLFEIGKINSTKGTAGEKGSGFGLILCKELVQRMDGEISVKSNLEEGSTFSIVLPNKG